MRAELRREYGHEVLVDTLTRFKQAFWKRGGRLYNLLPMSTIIRRGADASLAARVLATIVIAI